MKFPGKQGLLTTVMLMATVTANAGPVTGAVSFWNDNGWTLITDADGVVGPGGGGQAFDAEYLYYKLSGNLLELGLQTGFDVVDGHQTYNSDGHDYYAGDLALSFDGNVNLATGLGYEYGVDFGLLTRGYSNNSSNPEPLVDMGTGTGEDIAGLYSSVTWDNNIYYHSSDPFALTGGALDRNLISNSATQFGTTGNSKTFIRTVSFDRTGLGNDVDVHWTMSCGNDEINGSFSMVPLPEPSVIALLSLGLLGIGVAGFRRRRS